MRSIGIVRKRGPGPSSTIEANKLRPDPVANNALTAVPDTAANGENRIVRYFV